MSIKSEHIFLTKHMQFVFLSHPGQLLLKLFILHVVHSDGFLWLLMADLCANIHPLYKSQVQIPNVVKHKVDSHFPKEAFRKQSVRPGTWITLEPAEWLWSASFRNLPKAIRQLYSGASFITHLMGCSWWQT